MQQTLPHNSRFQTGHPGKTLVNPGAAGPGMMAGRMMAGVGDLSAGLQDLKKTAGAVGPVRTGAAA